MKLRNDLTLRQFGDEYIIVDPSQDMVDMSKVFTLNESAAFIWNELQDIDFTVEDIVSLLLESYEVSAPQATADAKNLVHVFEKQGLLQA